MPYLEQHVMYVTGLGVYVYAGSRASRPLESATHERRIARVHFGSPQLWCELHVGTEGAPIDRVLDQAVFPLDARDGSISICDGYAEMGWDLEDYAHTRVAVPPADYDVVLSALPAGVPGADWAVHAQLLPRERAWTGAATDADVDLFFDVRQLGAPREP